MMADAEIPFAIDVQTLQSWRGESGAIATLDVREPWERDICALPDSLAIPLGQLPKHVEALPRDRPLVVICHHGGRSAQATHWLRAQGFEQAINLDGGIHAWAQHIDPTMKVY